MLFFKRWLSWFFAFYAKPVGLGGGGAMYCPTISSLDPSLMFVACDMGGLYRTMDGGSQWTLLNQREIRGAPAGPIVCDPNDVNVVLVWEQMRARTFLKRSKDRGDTWTPLRLPVGATRVTALAVDRVPTLPGGSTYRLLCGTDAGAFYSDSNGQGWVAAGTVHGPSHAAADATVGILVLPDPSSAGYLYFLASTSAVYTSDDRGQTWRQQVGAVPLASIDSFSGGANGALTSSVMLYATGGGSFTSSADGGATWTAAQAGGFRLVGASDSNPEIAYAATTYPQIVRKSSDGGATWSDSLPVANPPAEKGWLEHDRAGWDFGGEANGLTVSRSDANVAAMSNDGVVYRTDNGTSWREIYSAPAAASAPAQPWRSIGLEVTTTYFYDVDPTNAQNHYISYTDIGFARSDDGGSRWYSMPPWNSWKGNRYNTIYQIAFDPSTPGAFWAAASDVHDIPQPTYLQDVDVKGNWVPRGSGSVVRWSGNAWSDEYKGLPQKQVARSWQDPTQGTIDDAVPPVVSIVVDPNNANRRWCSVFGEGVYAWDSGAARWVKRSNGLGFAKNMNAYRLQYINDGTASGLLFCSVTARRNDDGSYRDESGLFRSPDGGLNWVNITATNGDIHYAADYAVSPGDPNIIFLATINRKGAGGALFRTLDAMSNAPQWAVVFDIDTPPQTPIGPLYWPDLGCFSVTIDPALTSTVFLCTLTHGTWISTAGGDPGTWSEFQAIPFLPTQRLFIHDLSSSWLSDIDTLYITTFGAGVWKVGLEWRFWGLFYFLFYFLPWWLWWRRWPWYRLRPIPRWLERKPLPWSPPKQRSLPDPHEGDRQARLRARDRAR